MADLNLTIALERYDRHVPLFMGAVKPPGLQGREEAMREYLVWEIDLVNQMAEDDDQRFRGVAG